MSLILPVYTHVVNKRLKHIYLSFDEEGRLIIKSPPVSQRYIESLLIRKSSWISKACKQVLAKKGRINTIKNGGYFYFMGTPFSIVFRKDTTKRASFESSEMGSFVFSYTHFDSEICCKKIEAYYKKEAESMIPHIVNRWAKKMRLFPEAVRFRKTKRQWGSCSAKNVLFFNTRLMKLPMEAIEYVVVHELAHIAHKHHQKAFWQLVESHLSDYRERQEILREYTPV